MFSGILITCLLSFLVTHRVAGFSVSFSRGCEGCFFRNFSVVLFPGEQCRDGIVLRYEAFALDFVYLCC